MTVDCAFLIDRFLDESTVSDDCHGTVANFECIETAILLGPLGKPEVGHIRIDSQQQYDWINMLNMCVCLGNLMQITDEWKRGWACFQSVDISRTA